MDPSMASLPSPFEIAVPDDALALLKRKLDDTRLPDEVVNAAEWKDGYDWRTHERKLNALPRFTRTIAVDGFGELDVHYVHRRAPPRVPSHCCSSTASHMCAVPGCFLEATKVLPLLTAVSADHPSFHVVAPSLPGYAWSEGVLKKGFNAKHYAELFNKLMISLGYTEYLTLTAASLYGPKHVKASYTNFPICELATFGNPIVLLQCLISSFTSRERDAAAISQNSFKNGMGYFREQATKSQTLGFSLADSPICSHGYMRSWSLLTWISIYWFSRAGPAASVRIYYEIGDAVIGFPQSTVPVGLSFFPKEFARFPKPRHTAGILLRSEGKIVFESDHEVGGHFAAYQQPEALVGDLRKMFGKSGPAASVVSGCDGY
ncbi:alpha/beta-hydrolase [Lactarius vividus]|nr:alpha/beta-hydrolase [Lactarius vividus]